MDTDQMIDKLASKLDDQELQILAHVMDKVASNAANFAVNQVVTHEDRMDKLASDLAASGFSMEEIHGELQKMAEEKATHDECEKIAKDCMAMGTIIGNTASDVFLENIRGFIDKQAEEEEEEEEEEKSDKLPPELAAKAEEKEEEAEKEASANRDVLRQILLQAAKL